MSRASAAVRFPDGTIRYILYNGTVDILIGALYDTVDEAWDAYSHIGGILWPSPDGEIEPVVIYSDFADGFYWTGRRAARNAVVGPLTADVFFDIEVEGKPDWLVWK